MNYEAYFLSSTVCVCVCVCAYKRQGRLSFFLGLCLFFFGKRRKTTVIPCPVGKTGKRQRKRFFFFSAPSYYFLWVQPPPYICFKWKTSQHTILFFHLSVPWFFVDWSYHVCPWAGKRRHTILRFFSNKQTTIRWYHLLVLEIFVVVVVGFQPIIVTQLTVVGGMVPSNVECTLMKVHISDFILCFSTWWRRDFCRRLSIAAHWREIILVDTHTEK